MIKVTISCAYDKPRFGKNRLKKLCSDVCRRFGLECADINIALVDDGEIRRLNKRFRGHNCVTDCLSFEITGESPRLSARAKSRSFELVVNGNEAVRQSGRRGHSAEAEVALYTVHSLLHQLGFDDSGPRKASRMHKIEDEILREYGYGAVYGGPVSNGRDS